MKRILPQQFDRRAGTQALCRGDVLASRATAKRLASLPVLVCRHNLGVGAAISRLRAAATTTGRVVVEGAGSRWLRIDRILLG